VQPRQRRFANRTRPYDKSTKSAYGRQVSTEKAHPMSLATKRDYRGKTYLERLEDEFVAVPWSGCWLHLGRSVGRGYSKRPDGERAHRAFYRAFVGEIPEGQVIAHKCDVACCVNPAHLVACSQLENIDDMERKGRRAKGERVGTSKLTQVDVVAIVAHRGNYRHGLYTALGLKFGVHRNIVRGILRGERWRHVSC
jgi:hypothetical protein